MCHPRVFLGGRGASNGTVRGAICAFGGKLAARGQICSQLRSLLRTAVGTTRASPATHLDPIPSLSSRAARPAMPGWLPRRDPKKARLETSGPSHSKVKIVEPIYSGRTCGAVPQAAAPCGSSWQLSLARLGSRQEAGGQLAARTSSVTSVDGTISLHFGSRTEKSYVPEEKQFKNEASGGE